MDEVDVIVRLAQGGATAVLVAANIAQWREIRRLTAYIQKLLDDALIARNAQEQAAIERFRIARAVGVFSPDETQGKRPNSMGQ